MIARENISDLQIHEIAAAQFAVNAQVEEGKLTQATLHLQAVTQRPDLLDFELGFLSDDHALAPRFAMNHIAYCFHATMVQGRATGPMQIGRAISSIGLHVQPPVREAAQKRQEYAEMNKLLDIVPNSIVQLLSDWVAWLVPDRAELARNLVPELIGMLIEVVLIVFLLQHILRARDKRLMLRTNSRIADKVSEIIRDFAVTVATYGGGSLRHVQNVYMDVEQLEKVQNLAPETSEIFIRHVLFALRGLEKEASNAESRLEKLREIYGYAFTPNISHLFDRVVRHLAFICALQPKHPDDFDRSEERVREATDSLAQAIRSIRNLNMDFRSLHRELCGTSFHITDWPFTRDSIVNIELFSRQLRLLNQSTQRKFGLIHLAKRLFKR